MYYSLFKDLKISETDLHPSKVPLVGFNGALVWPLGMITLPVRAGSVVLDIEFVVFDVPSPYNAIIGHTWLHKLKAITSTYHQVVRFIGTNGYQEDLYGDQTAAKRYIGRPANEKAVEDLVAVPITEDGSRFFLVGSSLSDTEQNKMVDFLNKNIERPVVQRARRFSLVHFEAVIKEVNRVLNAKAIREVQYPIWLANTVVVKKKNGKCQVCVDYSNLNHACPEDFFPLSQIDQLVDTTPTRATIKFP
ncbi:uncharacterized protein LOC131323921 [Rhododendron vialii]|uniref:uncharacterized protein LOC131323921 n=1 Tax=Rhododendron vialii TaxID=182163 RepID=UPI00265DDD5D|nr:uncharacterized protein LOC131323921 [Rhododendron vialii]